MNRATILQALSNAIRDVLPEADFSAIRPAVRLTDYGASSIDRAEIVTYAMRSLDLRIPPSAFGGVATLDDLIAVFESHLSPL